MRLCLGFPVALVLMMDEQKKQELLARVRVLSERARELQRESAEVASERALAVQNAMEFGVPREEIAKAAGVVRTAIYRIAAER